MTSRLWEGSQVLWRQWRRLLQHASKSTTLRSATSFSFPARSLLTLPGLLFPLPPTSFLAIHLCSVLALCMWQAVFCTHAKVALAFYEHSRPQIDRSRVFRGASDIQHCMSFAKWADHVVFLTSLCLYNVSKRKNKTLLLRWTVCLFVNDTL